MRNKGAYIWMLLAKVGPQTIYLFATILLARILTPDEFGQVGVLAVFISIASTLNDAGLSGSLIKEQNVTTVDYATINIFNIGISSILYLCLFISAGFIEEYFDSPGLKNVTRSLGLVFLINSISTVPRAKLYKELKFRTISWISLVSVTISCVMAIVAAHLNAGVYSLVIYQLLMASIAGLLIIVKSKYSFTLKFSIDSLKRLMSFGVYTTLSNIVDNIYENILVFVFGKALDIKQAGYLAQAKKLDDAAVAGCKDTVNAVSFPVLTKLQFERDKFIAESGSILANSCRLLIPVFLTVCIFSSQIIKLLFGDAWVQSAPYLSILFIAGLFLLFESLYRNFVKSLGEVGLLFKYTLYKRLFTILLIAILALVQSDLILYGYCFGAAAGLMINIVLYSKVIKTTFIGELKSLINYSLPALVSALIIYVICLFTTKPLFCYIAAIVMWGIYFGVYLKGVDYVLKLRNKLK